MTERERKSKNDASALLQAHARKAAQLRRRTYICRDRETQRSRRHERGVRARIYAYTSTGKH
eukprot:6196117-Pleurochrysis_carterae.AAC.2